MLAILHGVLFCDLVRLTERYMIVQLHRIEGHFCDGTFSVFKGKTSLDRNPPAVATPLTSHFLWGKETACPADDIALG